MVTKEKYGTKVVNYHVASMLNSLSIRPTDCSFTFDYQERQLDNLELCLYTLNTTNELFEILLLLDLNGLQNLERYFLHKLLSKFKTTESVWEIRKINSAVTFLKESRKNEHHE